MFRDDTPGRLKAQDEYWFAVRGTDSILWDNARRRPRNNPNFEVRQRTWTKDDVYYAYNAARPIGAENMGTCIGSIILCTDFDVEKGVERYSRQLFQYQLSDALSDQICHGTFGKFTIPADAPEPDKAALINTMLEPSARYEVGMSLDTTEDMYLILLQTLRLGASMISRPES